MKSAELFKIYNRKKYKECLLIYIMIAVSLIISVSVSIAIPQIDHSIKDNIDKSAALKNGGDIKISANVVNYELSEKVEELEKSGEIKSSDIYEVLNSSIRHGQYNVYTTLIKGDYELAENEIIISSYTAKDIGVKVGDVINVSGENYKVADIEEQPIGVTSQAEEMGYCKVSNPDASGFSAAGAIFIISTDESSKVVEEFKTINGDFECTTIEDQKDSLKEQLNTNTLAMNMLNTMCIIMSLIAVFSSVFMIINQRKQDISIMKCLSIKTKVVKKALRLEIKSILVLPVIAGAVLSVLIAEYLLGMKRIAYIFEISDIIVGALFFLIMYFLFVDIITLVISSIDPIAFLRDSKQNFSSDRIKIVIISFIYLLISMFVYGIFYVGNSNAFVGSIIIIFVLILFFALVKILLSLLSILKFLGKITKYTLGRIGKNSSVTAMLILNLSLMGWFIMFGFTFDKVSSVSLQKNIEKKINYSYLLATKEDQSDNITDALRKKNIRFTRLDRSMGYIVVEDNVVRSEIGIIDSTNNGVKFNISDGKHAEELIDGEVLVSAEFAEKNDIIVGDRLNFYSQGNAENNTKETIVIVAGIYQSGNINDYTMVASEVNGLADNNSVLFLICADNLDFMEGDISKDTIVADISMVEDALESLVSDYIFYFKNMCLICIVAVFIFIINMMFIEYYDNKEIVVIKAFGLSRKFLYRSMYLKQIIVNVIGFVLALELYDIVINVLLSSMLETSPQLTTEVFIIPLVVFISLCIVCIISEQTLINKNCTKYEMLREKD